MLVEQQMDASWVVLTDVVSVLIVQESPESGRS